MSDTQETDAKFDISAEDVFKPTKGDAAYRGLKIGLGGIPVFGGVAAELFGSFIAEPQAKRLEAFLISVDEGLKTLEEKVEGFSIDKLVENEIFVSTTIQAYQAVIRTHSKEKHEALRNAVLNSALPKAPDENRQAMFIQLCDELTDLHMHVLKLFEGTGIPSINLDDADWRKNIALKELADLIETTYPDYEGEFSLYIQVIDDLHRRGLIVNKLPAKNLMTKIARSPTLSPFAKEFLAFIKSPFDDD